MNDFVSPVDGHLHHGGAARDECAVCRLEADRDRWKVHAERVAGERDRLTAEVTSLGIQSMEQEGRWHDLVAERNRLVERLNEFARDCPIHVAERDRLGMALEEEQEVRSEAVAERDRLRADLAVERQNARVLQVYFDEAVDKAEQAEAERDRLRAVVDAARVASDAGSLVGVLAALHQLDVGEGATDG